MNSDTPFVIPAIDLIGGRAVRLWRGDYTKLTDYGNPQDLVTRYIEAGAVHLHLVDLEAARGTASNLATIANLVETAESAGVTVQTGGGIRSRDDLKKRLDAGLSQVVCGTRAAQDPEGFIEMVAGYEQNVILGLDTQDGQIRTQGWEDGVAVSVPDLLSRLTDLPLYGVVHTDIARDGTGHGPNLDATLSLCRDLARRAALAPAKVVVSGGVADLQQIEAASKYPEFSGIIVGTALCRGDIDPVAALAIRNQ